MVDTPPPPPDRSNPPPPGPSLLDDEPGLAAFTAERLGFRGLRPVQRTAIRCVLDGRDALVTLPTGAGKSACYQLPALLRGGVTVVVSPLIALMDDQVTALQARNCPARLWSSSLSASDRNNLRHSLEQPNPGTLLLYVAPEALRGPLLVTLATLFRHKALTMFAIDEAHCISAHGHSFRPMYRRLSVLRTRFPSVPIIALTASAPPAVRTDIVQLLGLRDPTHVRTSFNRPEIRYQVLYCRGMEDKLERLRSLIPVLNKSVRSRPKPPKTDAASVSTLTSAETVSTGAPSSTGICSGIVYCYSKAECEEVAAFLSAGGIPCRAYHAGLSASERADVQREWTTNELAFVAATIAFGMGINKADVRIVVHFSIPRSIEGFYQESGRAGRDQRASHSVLLYSARDEQRLEFHAAQDDKKRKRSAHEGQDKESDIHRKIDTKIECDNEGDENGDSIGQTPSTSADEIESQHASLKRVIKFCLDLGCRREFLLSCFGESMTEFGTVCNRTCDVCRDPDYVRRCRNECFDDDGDADADADAGNPDAPRRPRKAVRQVSEMDRTLDAAAVQAKKLCRSFDREEERMRINVASVFSSMLGSKHANRQKALKDLDAEEDRETDRIMRIYARDRTTRTDALIVCEKKYARLRSQLEKM